MEANVYQAIFLGVISGVITTLILSLVVLFFKKIFTPWYEERVYKGIDVSGAWKTCKKEGNWELYIFINLNQKGHNIEGTFQAKTSWFNPTREYTNHYQIQGEIVDNHLLINYKALPKDRTGLGSFLLRVSQGGKKLRGGAVYIADGDSDEIATLDELIFVRS